MVDPQAGEVSAPPTPRRKVVASRSAGVARSSDTRPAKITETARIASSTAISNRRESMTSAKAPAGSVNRNNGRLTATWTRDTMIGLASRLVISQPDAVSNMAVPTFDMTLAVHMTVNTTWLKGPHREGTGWVGAAEELRFALTLVSSAQRVRQGKAPPGHHLFLGYVIRGAAGTLWHSGDCVPFDGLVEEVAPLFPDIALLPVNGRRAELRSGVPGNFTVAEAIDITDRIGASYLVAHHYGMFDFNTVSPEVIDEMAGRRQRPTVLRARYDMYYTGICRSPDSSLI